MPPSESIPSPSSSSSPYWPQPRDAGTSIEGIYEALEAGKYREVVVLRTPQGIRKLNATTKVQAVLPTMTLGAAYRVTYAGLIPTAKGNTLKDIRIERVEKDPAPPAAPLGEPTDQPDDVPF